MANATGHRKRIELFRIAIYVTKISEMLPMTFKDNRILNARVFQWYKRFKKVSESIVDESLSYTIHVD